MKEKIALVFGATGLVGKQVVDTLLKSEEYSLIKIFLRKEGNYSSSKIQVIQVNFSKLEDHISEIKGDEIFCCLGTTIKKAGTQKAFREVDYHLVLQLGKIAKGNQVHDFKVISSLGANPKSSNFYLRVKGEMEEALKNLKLERLLIMRPSLLLGKREEKRMGGNFGKILMKFILPLMMGSLKKYRPVYASKVAFAMIHFKMKAQVHIVESDQIEELFS